MSKALDRMITEDEDITIELMARDIIDSHRKILTFEQAKDIAKEAYIKCRDKALKEMEDEILFGGGNIEPKGLLKEEIQKC